MPGPGIYVRPHGQMRRLADGTLVFMARGHLSDQTYERDAGAPGRVNYLYRSADGGRTWQPPSPIRRGWSETGFLPLDGEHWVAYVRHNEQPNQIAHSYDGGLGWTRWEPASTAVPGTEPEAIPHMGNWRMVIGRPQKPSPGSVARLPNGLVPITYGYRAYPFGVRAIVSRDGGESFETDHEYVLSDLAFSWDCGYPSTVCIRQWSGRHHRLLADGPEPRGVGDLLPGLPLLPGPARRIDFDCKVGTRSVPAIESRLLGIGLRLGRSARNASLLTSSIQRDIRSQICSRRLRNFPRRPKVV